MQTTRKILFISHDTFLTGAPVLLLHLMRLLKENGYACNTLVRLNVDVLADAFREVSDQFDYFEKPIKPFVLRRYLKNFANVRKIHRVKRMLEGVDMVFSNTITNGAVLRCIRPGFRGKIISYVHELDMAASWYSSPEDLDTTLHVTDHFFAPCEAVKKFLINRKQVPAHKVSILRYYIPPFSTVDSGQLERFRQLAGLQGAFVVGAIGTVGWRKGIDLFLSVAVQVCSQMPGLDIKFVWMGGEPHDPEVLKAKSDLIKADLSTKVQLLPQSTANSVFFQSIDVLLLCSREDPYPVVVLEAASVSVPAICFEHAGGAPEFVGNGAGCIVPYLDIEAMANSIVSYYYDRVSLALHGVLAKERVTRLHQDNELILSQMVPFIS